MLNEALAYHRAGLRVVPCKLFPDKNGKGSLRPSVPWERYKDNQTEAEVLRLFSGAPDGLAIIMGNGIECIDIDTKHDQTGKIKETYKDELFWGFNVEIPSDVVVVKTKSGGWHIIYKAPIIGPNQKLTILEGSPEAVIETRGEGGLIFAAPTPGYCVKQGAYTAIPEVTQNIREAFINAALAISVRPAAEPPQSIAPAPQKAETYTTDAVSPWQAYDATTKVGDVLERHGWKMVNQRGNYARYSRPNSKSGDVHGSVLIDKNIFHPFTTATEFDSGKNYGPYAVTTVLEYSGNWSASAKALLTQGYGQRAGVQSLPSGPATEVVETPDALWEFLLSNKYDINAPVEEAIIDLRVTTGGKSYNVCPRGGICAIVGAQKSGKTLITSAIIASALGATNPLGISFTPGPGRIIFFDTEQPKYFFQLTQRRVYQMAGVKSNPPNYEAYNLRRLSVADRIKAIDMVLSQPGKVAAIVIDGIVDICNNFNDEKASADTIQRLMSWSDHLGATLFPILHLTKADGFMRGHLGTALQNKADAAFEVVLDQQEGRHTVKHREARFARFPSFDFYRDSDGLPYIDQPTIINSDGPEVEPVHAQAYNPIITSVSKINNDDDIPF